MPADMFACQLLHHLNIWCSACKASWLLLTCLWKFSMIMPIIFRCCIRRCTCHAYAGLFWWWFCQWASGRHVIAQVLWHICPNVIADACMPCLISSKGRCERTFSVTLMLSQCMRRAEAWGCAVALSSLAWFTAGAFCGWPWQIWNRGSACANHNVR